ncbi:Uma2 family endonuclease [Frankia sp. CNm7]|uniref:Uma2 family endonuclease n=1 Tax=Frankia nepalensis TaxID=1836974 RepID=A0A937UNH2_9ACTN|nr:Uma2 family endonuclease [Frankia nepalensis]MBL7498173.1 Uma2 family endonuclease [Frankia nepalensis]MBL7509309.1 Uma2 family endonuclease [Frankia nepalensis]MBL7519310.1 Uma2 family endonuclease [Frankia nepalensis]MBL7627962.1 Uma2 family endonuclease [Frankia nepalensis]
MAAEKVTSPQYDRWSEERRSGIEIADGRVVTAAVASTRRRRAARLMANALDLAGGPDWNADVAVEVRLTDAPLTIRRPDVVVYRADALDATPMHAEHVLCVVELVSRGSQATGRIVGVHRYAQAGIGHYWRVEWSATGIPIACTYVLDPASKVYREHAVCAGVVHVTEPFPVTINLTQLT